MYVETTSYTHTCIMCARDRMRLQLCECNAEQGDPRRRNFRGDDERNYVRRYEDVLGVQVSLSLPLCVHRQTDTHSIYTDVAHTCIQPKPAHHRGSLKGFHIAKRYTHLSYVYICTCLSYLYRYRCRYIQIYIHMCLGPFLVYHIVCASVSVLLCRGVVVSVCVYIYVSV
jgi:hypothetical protein